MTDMGCAPWVARHWAGYWFSVRHTGTAGHNPDQCRRHARHWIALLRTEDAR